MRIDIIKEIARLYKKTVWKALCWKEKTHNSLLELTHHPQVLDIQNFLWIYHLLFSFNFRSPNLSLFHKWFWRVLYALLWGGILSRVEPFGCARGHRHGFLTLCCYLLVTSQSLTPLSRAHNFFRLNFSFVKYVLSSPSIGSEGQSLKYSMNMSNLP